MTLVASLFGGTTFFLTQQAVCYIDECDEREREREREREIKTKTDT